MINNNECIKFKEVQCQIEDIQDKFAKDNLPIDFLDEICVEEADYNNLDYFHSTIEIDIHREKYPQKRPK